MNIKTLHLNIYHFSCLPQKGISEETIRAGEAPLEHSEETFSSMPKSQIILGEHFKTLSSAAIVGE